MSRRSRIKFGRHRQPFDLAHHSDYASTTTYFPKAFSLFGNDIKFPKSILPIFLNSKIHYVGKAQNFFNEISAINLIQQKVVLASISIEGEKYQQASWKTNLAMYATSMMCFCLGNLMNKSAYREKCYSKYKFDDYETLAKIIQRFDFLQTLIINFQDNDINEEKMRKLDSVIARSKIKTLVLRNLCYFIQPKGVENFFHLARTNKNMHFTFIWQKFSLISIPPAAHKEEDQQHNLMSIPEQIQY